MSLETTVHRIAQLQALVDPQAADRARGGRAVWTAASAGVATPLGAGTPTADGAAGPFAAALRTATAGPAATPMIDAARSQAGVVESPPGSNDSPQIATYRQAVEGAPGPGPWCAYFVSWAARQAGTPLGDRGEGFGSVDAMWAWAQRSGRAVPNGPGVTPRVGDVVILDQHTGIVAGVRADGTVETIEGNTSDRVADRTHPPGEAIGSIRMG